VSPIEGMTFLERSSGTSAVFRNGVWEMGMLRGGSLLIAGQQVVGVRTAAIDSPAGGAVIDVEGRTAIDAILTALRQHGLIET
jgi:imidazolonepropionase-like amidohydrolase